MQWTGENIDEIRAFAGFDFDVSGNLLRIGMIDYIGPGQWIIKPDEPDTRPYARQWQPYSGKDLTVTFDIIP